MLKDWLYRHLHSNAALRAAAVRRLAGQRRGKRASDGTSHHHCQPPEQLRPSAPERKHTPQGVFPRQRRVCLWGMLITWFLRSYGAFPVDRDGADIRAYRWVISQLRAGKPVVLFPEGTRSRNGMNRAKPGIAQIALQSQASILPVGIVGTHRLGTWMRVFNPTGKLTVNIGQVFSVPPIEGRPSKELLESISDMIMQRVAMQLPGRDSRRVQ